MYRWMNEKAQKRAFLPVGMQKRRRRGVKKCILFILIKKRTICS
jgi:hypothetical protein